MRLFFAPMSRAGGVDWASVAGLPSVLPRVGVLVSGGGETRVVGLPAASRAKTILRGGRFWKYK